MAANLPMVHASTVESSASGHTHCVSGGVQQTSPPHTDHARHSGSCGCGCQCACAQALALARALDEFSATPHLPVTVPYRVMDVPQVANGFFRPPI
jgi:hypothetical protein